MKERLQVCKRRLECLGEVKKHCTPAAVPQQCSMVEGAVLFGNAFLAQGLAALQSVREQWI